MDQIQSELFGTFPRRVGTPSQHWVFNEAQVDLFLDTIDGRRNAYSALNRLPLDGTQEADKVLFDLDGDKSVFPDDADVREMVDIMRHNRSIATGVLGEVCEDARAMAEAAIQEFIPMLGVFSGFGIHIHLLYRTRTEDVKKAMTTVAARWCDSLDLQTPDWKVFGDPPRLCRIPNAERVTMPGPRHEVRDGEPTGLYQIPLTRDDLATVTPEWLLTASESPRELPPTLADERDEMPVYDDYSGSYSEHADVPRRDIEQRETPIDDEGIETILDELLRMPCMVERIQQPSPEHDVRLNSAVMLFNAGMDPQQVVNLFARLGWVDFDPETTLSYLEQIYAHGYSDMGCATLRGKGLCVQDEPEDCRTYGWSGGRPEWKQ